MATLLYQGQDAENTYKVIYTNDKRYKISEYGLVHDTARGYHITRKLFQEIMDASEQNRLEVAKSVYEAARLKRKAR